MELINPFGEIIHYCFELLIVWILQKKEKISFDNFFKFIFS